MSSSGAPQGEFYLNVCGSIESADFYEIDNAYCKYSYYSGEDWSVIAGLEKGLSQTSKCSNDVRRTAVWNFPIDISFKTTTPHGWPSILLSLYGMDSFGHDIIRGYGVCRLPPMTGRHERRVPIYTPESSTIVQQFMAWITGRRPELIDEALLGAGDGRELTRMIVQGFVNVSFNVVLKDFYQLGYDNGDVRR